MAGLLGSGRTETARAIFGADSVEGGEVKLEGKTIKRGSVNEAIDSGIAFLTEDRKAEGIIPELSVRENLTLAALPALSTLGGALTGGVVTSLPPWGVFGIALAYLLGRRSFKRRVTRR